jgi:hypothetical protein
VALEPGSVHQARIPVVLPLDNLPQVMLVNDGLPQSRVREAYANSGRVRGNPAVVAGEISPAS